METRQELPAAPNLPLQAAPPHLPVPPPFPEPPRPPLPPQPYPLCFSVDQPPTTGSLPAPAPPELPPRLAVSTHFPPRPPTPPPRRVQHDAPNAESKLDSELPTYEGLQAKEQGNPRFGRWQGWVEKRAQERREERETSRATDGAGRTGWDLQQGEGTASPELADGRDDRIRDQKAEERLSRLPTAGTGTAITNPDPTASPSRYQSGPSSAGMSPSSSLGATRGVQRLTQSTSIHPLGSRFARGLVEQPRCACVLPISPTAGAGVGAEKMDRFVLVGTDEGLYLADLQPSLSSSTLRTTPAFGVEASILSVWKGAGLLQVVVVVEPEPLVLSPSTTPRGLVVGLVKLESGETELRMWSLAALANLARWRVHTESSCPLDLSSSLSSNSSSTSPASKRSSKAYIKSLFSSAPDKGKGRAPTPASAPTPLQHSLGAEAAEEEAGYVVIGQNHRRDGSSASSIGGTSSEVASRLLDYSRNASKSSLGPSSTASSVHHPAPSPASPTEHLALPLEWVNSFVRLPIPSARHSHSHTATSPILFFNVCRTPPSTPSHERGDPAIRERRSRLVKEREAKDNGAIWLVVATRGVIYLFHSAAGEEKRGWKLVREFYAPAQPRKVELVRSKPPHSTASPPSVGLTRRLSDSKRDSIDDAHIPADLALSLGMRNRLVLINVMDSSVQEVSSPGSPAPAHADSLAPPTEAAFHGRSRSTTTTSTSSTASASSTLSAASSLTARVVGAASGKVASLVEGKHGVPAGMRDKGMENNLARGRNVGEGGVVMTGEPGASADWVNSDSFKLVIRAPDGTVTVKQHHILTCGSTSSIYASPLPSLTALPAQPLATFSFPLTSSAPLVHVQALVRTHSLTPHARERGLFHLIVVAWTRTGVHVKEGIIDPFTEAGRGRWYTPLSAFHESPLAQAEVSVSSVSRQDDSEDDELDHQASFDFGREVVRVCEGGPWVEDSFRDVLEPTEGSDDDDEDEGWIMRARMRQEQEEATRATRSGVFFFVRGVGDWALKWIG